MFLLSRRGCIRLVCYALLLCSVLFSVIRMQIRMTNNAVAEQNRLRRTVLSHMTEENEDLRLALQKADSVAVRQHADALCGYISLISTIGSTQAEVSLLHALTDTIHFYTALGKATSQFDNQHLSTDLAFWQDCTDTISAHIASMALAMTDRSDPTQPTAAEYDAAAYLSKFSASFQIDPIYLTAKSSTPLPFEREPLITQGDARQILRELVGNAASFLGNIVSDDAHGCYLFSCQNGYAEISRNGGHLLSYAFYPRGNTNADSIRLNDTDLSAIAAAFLKKAGLPSSKLSVSEDRHGIRMFFSSVDGKRPITIGIRMHDGTVVQLWAEDYYLDPAARVE